MSAPDLESLSLLVRIAALGSVSRAARERGTSQQAASTRLAALERELGIPLLVRTRQGTRPTDDGMLVVEWATVLLEAASVFESATAALQATSRTSLRIAASMTIAEHLAPHWLVTLRATDPALRIELTAQNSSAVLQSVRGGTADIGFIETPDVPGDLHQRPIATDELVLVVGVDHPWAHRRAGVTVEELAQTPVMSRESGSGTRLAFERALAAAGHPPVAPAIELSTMSAIRTAVALGGAPAVLSILAVRQQLALGTLRQVRIRELRITRTLTAIWSGTDDPRPAADRLLQLASATVEMLPARR